jgi:hypothetical protein
MIFGCGFAGSPGLCDDPNAWRNYCRRASLLRSQPPIHHDGVMVRVRNDELAAQVCIRAALPGCSVELHDDGSTPSMYDLKIVWPDGTTGAVEVTAAADAPRTGLWQEVRKRSLIRQEPNLAGGWLVRILTSAQARELDKHLPNLLRDLEQAGRRMIWGNRHRRINYQLGQVISALSRHSSHRLIAPEASTSCPPKVPPVRWADTHRPLATR